MAILTSGNEFGKMLCGALDVNPSGVRKIVITCEANSLVKVEVEKYFERERTGAFLKCVADIDPASVVYVEAPVPPDGNVSDLSSNYAKHVTVTGQ